MKKQGNFDLQDKIKKKIHIFKKVISSLKIWKNQRNDLKSQR